MNARQPVHGRLIEHINEIEEGEFVEPDYVDADEAAAYRKFCDEMKQSDEYAKINIYRQPESSSGRPGQRKLQYLFDVGLDEYEFSQLMNRIRDEYGTGTYRMQGRDPHGGLLFNRAVHVEAPTKPDGDPKTRNEFNASDLFNTFQNALAEHQERTEQLFARFMNQRQNTGKDEMLNSMVVAFGMMEKMAGMFGAMPQVKAADPVSDLKRLVEMKEIMGTLFESDGGGAGKGLHDTLTETIKHFGPMLSTAFQHMQASQPGVARRPARLAPPGQPAQAPKSEQQKPKPQNVNAQLAAQVGVLLQNAKLGIDPEQMADTVIGMTPEAQLVGLKNFVERADVLDQMTVANIEVNEYLPWFTKLRDHLRAFFSDGDLQNEMIGDTLTPSDASAEKSVGAHESDT